MTPRNKLNNPYYFVKDGVIFKINVTNDYKDPCGKHYVTYVTEEKQVEKGQSYINNKGDYVVAETAGTVNVSTGRVDEATCATTFPYFKVTDTDSNEYYFWLDNFIEKGDVYKSSKFKKTIHSGETEEEVDFAQDYVNTVKRAIATAMANGTSFNAAKGGYPSYLFAKANDKITVNGKEVTVKTKGITSSLGTISTLPIISETNIVAEVLKVINEKTVDYANGMLKNIDKKVKETEGTATLISDSTTEAI